MARFLGQDIEGLLGCDYAIERKGCHLGRYRRSPPYFQFGETGGNISLRNQLQTQLPGSNRGVDSERMPGIGGKAFEIETTERGDIFPTAGLTTIDIEEIRGAAINADA